MRFGGTLLREAAAFVLAGITVIFALALYSFSPHDPSFNHATQRAATNLVGMAGSYISDFLYQLFGFGAWVLLLLLIALTVRVAIGRRPWFGNWTSLFWLPMLLGISALIDAHQTSMQGVWPTLPAGPGGALGGMLAGVLSHPFHAIGRDILLVVLTLSSFVAASHISLILLGKRIASGLSWCSAALLRMTTQAGRSLAGRKERMQALEQRHKEKKERVKRAPKSKPEVAKQAKPVQSKRAKAEQQVELALKEPARGSGGFKLPGLSLFSAERKRGRAVSDETLQAMARMLEKKLMDYRVEGEVVAVQPGPVVTQFEFEPAPGTKVSRIVALQDDLARSMSAVSVRVAGNIPGKSVIGIEIPNQDRETVYMYDVLASKEFSEGKRILPLALGVDIAGTPVVADLAKMPHLLVAGTTGSGKSVSVNGMICSMLMTYSPKDLRMIMVDPKMLELSMYDDIPHLLVPVVTNPNKAAKALAWAVFEMDRRYHLMSEAKVRNIDSYNKAAAKKPEDEAEHLPFIVVVIDELADLMMVAGREVEQSICRLAQKARAAGIHLILATQRPSVDVITGLIKANLPSRISFQVSSRVDSRTILDQMGAEQLLGQGDSLFLRSGRDLQRVHGAFVSDAEVVNLVEYLKAQGEPDYREEVFEVESEASGGDGGEGDDDPKYDEAVALVIERGQCSVSMVQRYLRIGYNRASRVVERMEREGLVTPPKSGGMREVLARRMEDGGGVIE